MKQQPWYFNFKGNINSRYVDIICTCKTKTKFEHTLQQHENGPATDSMCMTKLKLPNIINMTT